MWVGFQQPHIGGKEERELLREARTKMRGAGPVGGSSRLRGAQVPKGRWLDGRLASEGRALDATLKGFQSIQHQEPFRVSICKAWHVSNHAS